MHPLKRAGMGIKPSGGICGRAVLGFGRLFRLVELLSAEAAVFSAKYFFPIVDLADGRAGIAAATV